MSRLVQQRPPELVTSHCLMPGLDPWGQQGRAEDGPSRICQGQAYGRPHRNSGSKSRNLEGPCRSYHQVGCGVQSLGSS